MLSVQQIPVNESEPWILTRHYARRMCPISLAFGAFCDGVLCGVVTFGTPVSSSLRGGICGESWSSKVIELNRLCCDNKQNLASALVGGALRLLPKPSIVVSFADTGMGHVGYVYQATNFIYTGLSAKRTDWKIKGREHMHGATIADESRGQEHRSEWMRAKYGDDFYLQERSRKHRYIFFVGSRQQVKDMKSALRYPIEQYPKGDSKRYDASSLIEKQGVML